MDAYERLRAREKERCKTTWGELPQMSPATLRMTCIEHDGYETPELNDKLYLHFKGFRHIQNLEPYYGLKCLWLESNAITEIVGLSHLKQLKCLYLQQNQITKISGLSELSNLVTLNLSENKLTKVEGLDKLPKLQTLNLANNLMQEDADIEHLKTCNSLTNLDLSSNELQDGKEILGVLKDVGRLAAVYLKGNPMVKTTKHYRKTVITTITNIRYLDERPVFDMERHTAEAWAIGGSEAEKRARTEFQQAKRNKDKESMNAFKEWKAKIKAEREEAIRNGVVPKVRKNVEYRRITGERQDHYDNIRREQARIEAEAEAFEIRSGGIAKFADKACKEELRRAALPKDPFGYPKESILEEETKHDGGLSSPVVPEMMEAVPAPPLPEAVAAPAPEIPVLEAAAAPPLPVPSSEVPAKKSSMPIVEVEDTPEEEPAKKEEEEVKNTTSEIVSASLAMYQAQKDKASREGKTLTESFNSELPTEVTWNDALDEHLQDLVHKKVFEFTSVAMALSALVAANRVPDIPRDMSMLITPDACRLRWAALDVWSDSDDDEDDDSRGFTVDKASDDLLREAESDSPIMVIDSVTEVDETDVEELD